MGNSTNLTEQLASQLTYQSGIWANQKAGRAKFGIQRVESTPHCQWPPNHTAKSWPLDCFNFDQNGSFQAGQPGSLDNPLNLATQSAYSNQQTMQIFEEKVRTALEANKKVIYKVTTVFRGNELMPRGYWVQAISTDGTLNFNDYVWNVEPGVAFDYMTGRSHLDASMQVKDGQNIVDRTKQQVKQLF